MPSILQTKARRVLRYLNKYGFENFKLTLYILNESASLAEVVLLEQDFINSLSPNLNVDLVASSSGYHEPMSEAIKEKLRKERGISIYIYDINDFCLLHIFDSKQQMYNTINIHHATLNDCLYNGKVYLDTYYFSLDPVEESVNSNLLTLDEIKHLISTKRNAYIVKQPKSKSILAEHKNNSSLNKVYSSLNFLAKELKGDRQVIREYLNGTKSGYYRGI